MNETPLGGAGHDAGHYAEAIWVDTPGVTSARLEDFSYAHRRRPLHPFEPEASLP
ncbi:hypothetical protein [Phytohabitans kaempferiae]|uniref:Uncharacterized protein n=1 Tax=Phytohabitans kaempferiae TaxID=1620943 RepID=A0ABV6MBH4_9ACTN